MSVYEAFTADTLRARLADVAAVTDRLGRDTSAWQVKEVGDGNLNLVFVVTSPSGALIVKQPCPICAWWARAGPCPCAARSSSTTP